MKDKYKILIGIIIGIMLSMSVTFTAATLLSSEDISYNNRKSGGSKTTVQGAVDELYEKAYSCNDSENVYKNIVKAYQYNQNVSQGEEGYCITGDEPTCRPSACYKTKVKNSCPPGTIIDYLVNDRKILRFHVMEDSGTIIKMQSQQNIINSLGWSSSGSINGGPDTIFEQLFHNTVNDWLNTKSLHYTIGNNNTDNTLGYSGCSSYNSCSKEVYSTSISGHARIITVQEANKLGCTTSSRSCPKWMYNYLKNSTSYGGTKNDSTTTDTGYWTLSVYANSSYNYAWYISENGSVNYKSTSNTQGVRPIIEISK